VKRRIQYICIILLLILSGVSGFLLSLYKHPRHFHSPTSFVKQIQGDKDAGRKIFNEFCASCHGNNPIISVNAPRINDRKRWDAYRNLSIDTLLMMTIQGRGAMPARGGCFECSDEQLREVILYILPSSRTTSYQLPPVIPAQAGIHPNGFPPARE
jgi:cytochrome c5